MAQEFDAKGREAAQLGCLQQPVKANVDYRGWDGLHPAEAHVCVDPNIPDS